jgi:hypothetical protein
MFSLASLVGRILLIARIRLGFNHSDEEFSKFLCVRRVSESIWLEMER